MSTSPGISPRASRWSSFTRRSPSWSSFACRPAVGRKTGLQPVRSLQAMLVAVYHAAHPGSPGRGGLQRRRLSRHPAERRASFSVARAAATIAESLARVAELADAQDSGSCPGNWVEVQVLSRAFSRSGGCSRRRLRYDNPGAVAQSVEHRTFNPLVLGSSPSGPTWNNYPPPLGFTTILGGRRRRAGRGTVR